VAKVFLGDVGSLPIGLLLGWCLLQLAWHHQFLAALLLPLYYLADTSVTLIRRIAKRESFWIAHRSHFYQRATDNGFTVRRVICEVFALNLFLAVSAIVSVLVNSVLIHLLIGTMAAVAVTLLLCRFSQKRAP
jgi:UDP-N-acetylmuramyl pentapeptide phosphotransferase/UDP-N-acetylglucosamine-1-phosphate transferase